MKTCIFFSCIGGRPSFFQNGLLTAVRSARQTNPSMPIVVLHDRLTSEETARLEGCALVRVDSAQFRSAHREDLTAAAFFKLCLERLEGYDRVLYLDGDLVVLDDLSEIFSLPGALVARRERYDLAHEYLDPAQAAAREGLKNDGPFMNSGVVCFDRNFWVREKILERALRLADEYGWDFFKNSDQGILNILAHRTGGFTPMPVRYNFCRWPDMVYNRWIRTAVNPRGLWAPLVAGPLAQRLAAAGVPPALLEVRPAAVVHWNGPVKPWEFDEKLPDSGERRRFFYECYRQFRPEP